MWGDHDMLAVRVTPKYIYTLFNTVLFEFFLAVNIILQKLIPIVLSNSDDPV